MTRPSQYKPEDRVISLRWPPTRLELSSKRPPVNPLWSAGTAATKAGANGWGRDMDGKVERNVEIYTLTARGVLIAAGGLNGTDLVSTDLVSADPEATKHLTTRPAQ